MTDLEQGLNAKCASTKKSSVMENSILQFQNVDFTVGSGDKQKKILDGVNGSVKWGRVLAIMGPSGAGKTTLINTLTLDAHYGKTTGTVTLNGVKMTDSIFRQHCYVVVQHDKHWPYLTCRETLQYAAELYAVDSKKTVEDIIKKMGLISCADTRNARLSGGQRRRLSIGVALLKQATVLFLDEPTSGLDAAAASNIMQEIVRMAKEENLIVFCTIHQPSTKVYNGFDQLMIMSRGRQAFAGDVADATTYFSDIGYPCPPATNPAEFFLDLVNSDFSDEKAITNILDSWEEKHSSKGATSHGVEQFNDTQDGVVNVTQASLSSEITIMFRRHALMILRDPILYIGRCFVFLLSCCVFGFVYWKGRENDQQQAINKLWVNIWYVSVPTNMGVVAVYALNDEFKSVMREAKNGMVTGLSYVLAKSVLVFPIFFIFALFALGIPLFVIQDAEMEAFFPSIILFAALIFVFESVAECLSVWFDDPIMGMLHFMNFWFASFLFGGFLIPQRDMYWPFELFYYIMPYHYYVKSSIYELFRASTFEPCAPGTLSAVCTPNTNGLDVLQALGLSFSVLDTNNTTTTDILTIFAIGVVWKILYIICVLYKTSKVSKIHSLSGSKKVRGATTSSAPVAAQSVKPAWDEEEIDC